MAEYYEAYKIPLYKDCLCLRCLGCNKEGDPSFKGKFTCNNFIEANEPEKKFYGAAYGNND